MTFHWRENEPIFDLEIMPITAEIFDWSGWQREQWVLEMEREKEKMTFASWGSSLTKFKGKLKDNVRFTKLPKI